MGGANNTSPLTAYTTSIKSPTSHQIQGSTFNQTQNNPVSKPTITNLHSPSSLNRGNYPTTTLSGNYTGIKTSYNTYTTTSSNNNPPQTNFWRKQ